jgi:hypothetical protein
MHHNHRTNNNRFMHEHSTLLQHHDDNSTHSVVSIGSTNLTNGWMIVQRELRKQFYDIGESMCE